MADEKPQAGDKQLSGKSTGLRPAAILILFLVAAYVIAVMSGLPKERRIDAATLGIVGLGALIAGILFRPDILERVTRLEVAGWKVEIEKRQEKQDRQLDYMRLVLPVLLPNPERQHLLNLANNNAKTYKGNHELRTELRRLRSLGLIKSRGEKHVGEITNDRVVDLSEYMELTRLGHEWVDRIKEFAAEKTAETATAAPG